MRDHPRVCGEHRSMSCRMVGLLGSSPRMRGTPQLMLGEGLFCGIIPAYAGNTSNHSKLHMVTWDHPRVCGEHRSASKRRRPRAGSSPRMRGTLPRDITKLEPCGIIPAYAGNTWNLYQSKTARRDHPRVCGEHRGGNASLARTSGSSPRMRGTLEPRGGEHAQQGIIPAYAGNTSGSAFLNTLKRDHPRVCGEHRNAVCVVGVLEGSSPRMRGTLHIGELEDYTDGIIPAYAGNTSFFLLSVLLGWDHPRVCGEHIV